MSGIKMLLSGQLLLWLVACAGTAALEAGGPLPADGQGAADGGHEIRFPVQAGLQARAWLSETVIMVQVEGGQPVRLGSIYPWLYRYYYPVYFKVGDYDRDGYADLAVLQNVGHGGVERCYAIYRYQPASGQFMARRSFEVCNI
ncbi:MAG: hypothetical protein KDI44_10055 [Thiothrix sp.]|nr:hypothetical protein [Thiothrix sp.]HPQ95054.1 hypothetical protein [Thiolinea sp.]